MKVRDQKRLALLGAASAIGILIAANAHLVVAALGSQPDCVAIEAAATPAKRAC